MFIRNGCNIKRFYTENCNLNCSGTLLPNCKSKHLFSGSVSGATNMYAFRYVDACSLNIRTAYRKANG